MLDLTVNINQFLTSIVSVLHSLFCNLEGSIVAKAGQDDNLHSVSAVLANICHEYIEFGQEAFNNNKLQALFI